MLETDASMPSVAVVLLNYNNYDPDTRRCLVSLEAIHEPDLTAVVVDNGSDDGCAEKIAAEFPNAVVLRQARNLGFAGGNNRGIEYALEHDFDYVLVLNNDTEITDPRLISDMVAALEANPNLGIIGPRVYDAEKGEEQTVMLTAPSWTLWERLFARPTHSREPVAPDTVSVEGVSAVCWLMPANLFRSVGLLDEDMFIYAEDNEFCYRVRKKGCLIGQYRDRIGVDHYFTSKKIPSLSSLRHRLSYVNYLYALRKHGASFPLGAVFVARTGVMLLGHLLLTSPKRTFLAEIRSYLRIMRDLTRQLASGRASIGLYAVSDGR
jgi:hypothetical protein